jgi:peptidoglycan/LPS O-acetylase OafA/YrhL
MLVYFARPDDVLGRMFRSLPLRGLGKYSYGMYVFHMILLGLLAFMHRNPIPGFFLALHSELLGVWAFTVAMILLTLLVAFISYHAFERPFLKLKDHFRS